jgi:hypothetical protein
MSDSTTRREAALAYAAAGRAVFPAHHVRADFTCSCGDPACEHVGKHPDGRLVPNGYLEASTDLDVVAAWWRTEPDANIAENPGRSREIVVDIDPRHGGTATWAGLVRAHPALGERTPMVHTPGGGIHIHWAEPAGTSYAKGAEETMFFAGPLGPGVELKAADASINLPPSNHLGGIYQWDAQTADLPMRPWTSSCRSASRKANTRAGRACASFTGSGGSTKRPSDCSSSGVAVRTT